MKHNQMSIMGRIGILFSLFALAACQSIIPRGQQPADPTAGTPPPPVETGQDPIEPGLPTDTERHRIALLLPLSGSNAGVGQSLANATTLALLDTKAQNLRITRYDTAKGARAAAQAAINDGNKLILGPLLSENVLQASLVATPAGIPIISYSNDVSVAGDKVFIMGHIPAQSIDRIVDYAKSRGMTKIAGLVPQGVYGQRASSALLNAGRKHNVKIVTLQSYDRSAASLRTALQRMQNDSQYEAILVADSGQMATRAAPLIRSNGGANARLLGTELWNTDSSLATTPAMRGAWFASVSDNLYRQYSTKYRAQFGGAPFRLSTLGYDSVLLTYRISRDWRPGEPFPTERLVSRDGFVGLDGVFRFMPTGINERALEVQQVGNGSFDVISAAPRSIE